MDVVIYHNPACGTSRNALALIRNAGVEPHVIECLKRPPSRAMVAWLAERTGLGVRGLVREKGTPFAELGLDDPSLSGEQLLDAIAAHPVLLNRPIVVSPGCPALPPVGGGTRPVAAAARRLRQGRKRDVDASGARVG